MKNLVPLHLALVALLLFAPALGVAENPVDRDLWIHPRDDGYDPSRHYKAQDGELFYHAENDIHVGLGNIVVTHDPEPRVEATVGKDLKGYVETQGGHLKPLLHWDSNRDGKVDVLVSKADKKLIGPHNTRDDQTRLVNLHNWLIVLPFAQRLQDVATD